MTDTLTRSELDAVQEIKGAWLNPGPCPDVHRGAIRRLFRDWPSLARAVDKLAAPQRQRGVASGAERDLDRVSRDLGRKLAGWDDHELVSVRAGDVRTLLTTIEGRRSPVYRVDLPSVEVDALSLYTDPRFTGRL